MLHYKHQRELLWTIQHHDGVRRFISTDTIQKATQLPRSSLLGRLKTLVRFEYLERERGRGNLPDGFKLTAKAVDELAGVA